MMGAQAPTTDAGDTGRDPGGGPTISESLENLVSSSQGVIAGRLDLALLEARELISRSVERAALAGVGMMLVAGAWMVASAAVVVGIAPHLPPALRLGAFAALCGLGALAFVGLAMRRGQLPPRPAPASPVEAAAAKGST